MKYLEEVDQEMYSTERFVMWEVDDLTLALTPTEAREQARKLLTLADDVENEEAEIALIGSGEDFEDDELPDGFEFLRDAESMEATLSAAIDDGLFDEG